MGITKKRLTDIQDTVFHILQMYDVARQSDEILYLMFLRQACDDKINVDNIRLKIFLENRAFWELPSYESVSRARRKVQALHPELKANPVVEMHKEKSEEVYKEWATDERG